MSDGPELTALSGFPGVSYIMPILNEAHHVADAVASVLGQDYEGAKEIVLALGPSTDGTNGIVAQLQQHEPRLKTVDSPTGRTPAALNLAIAASQYPVVVRVDAHTELDTHYTAQGVRSLLRSGAADVGGLMNAQGKTPFQRAVANAYHSRLGLGGAAYHSGAPEGPAESAYLGIFRREALDAVGHYDETFWRGQDWDLCLRLREAGFTVWFDPKLSVTYWPRTSWDKLIRQFYAAGIWRAELARRHKSGKSIRHILPPLLIAGLLVGVLAAVLILAGLTTGWPVLLNVFTGLLAMIPLFYIAGLVYAAAAAKGQFGLAERLWMLAVLPAIHVSWGFGFIRGKIFGARGTVDTGRRHK